jgi:putative tryptophan/tyrosine transport system substrate-binding protein
MSYGSGPPEAFRRAANAIVEILKGASPGDIPFYQASRFELVVNLKTARALDLAMPPLIMARADEVVE